MRFLIDAQLPPGLVGWIIKQGHMAEHVLELGLAQSDDILVWEEAVRLGATILTKDEDFAERTNRTVSGPPVVWLRIGNSTNRVLFAWLEPKWLSVIQLLDKGDRLIEVR